MRLCMAVLGLALCITAGAAADTLTLAGSSIPLRGCSIQAVRSGQVTYLDERGQRRRRPLEEVRALGFDDLPALDEAEQALADGDADERAITVRFIRALLAARSTLQRTWVHVRLCRLHDQRGQFVLAARHAASVWLLDADSFWRVLEPVSDPALDQPTYVAAAEALQTLREADRDVRQPSLARVVDRLLPRVRELHDRLARAYRGAPIEPGSTISGIDRRDIAAPGSTESARETTSPAAGDRALPSATAIAGEDPESPDAIDALLRDGRFDEAVTVCRRVARAPGDRSLAQFLHRYGAALSGHGEKQEAAIMYMRCAILFPRSAQAPASLIETALIYAAVWQQPVTARRLLDEAVEAAREGQRPALERRARDEIRKLSGTE